MPLTASWCWAMARASANISVVGPVSILPLKNSNCLAAYITQRSQVRIAYSKFCRWCSFLISVKWKSSMAYQIIATHHSNIEFESRPTCKVSSPISINTVCVPDTKYASSSIFIFLNLNFYFYFWTCIKLYILRLKLQEKDTHGK